MRSDLDRPRRFGLSMVVAAAAATAFPGYSGYSFADVKAEAAPANTLKDTQMEALARSVRIFELILEDIKATYPYTGGGGITSIRQNSTTSFTASIAQEERVDKIVYEIEIRTDGSVAISGKDIGADTK
jgi:N-acetylglucosamine kinase-like BadF-type ATPase